jgi:uncharacterized membrane protein YecN with MAPEG domain
MTFVPVIVPFYAAILAIIFIFLSVRVARMRGETNIGIGHGGNPVLERRMRVQANFAEFVPFALLLLAFLEMQQHSRYLIHLLALALLIGRIIHAYGVSQDKEDIRLRATGISITALVILIAAVLLLINGLRAAMI